MGRSLCLPVCTDPPARECAQAAARPAPPPPRRRIRSTSGSSSAPIAATAIANSSCTPTSHAAASPSSPAPWNRSAGDARPPRSRVAASRIARPLTSASRQRSQLGWRTCARVIGKYASFSCQSVRAPHETPVDHDAGADARSQRDEDEAREAFRGAQPALADGCGVRVVLDRRPSRRGAYPAPPQEARRPTPAYLRRRRRCRRAGRPSPGGRRRWRRRARRPTRRARDHRSSGRCSSARHRAGRQGAARFGAPRSRRPRSGWRHARSSLRDRRRR